MKYEPPIDDNGNPYYVPVVAKNRDFLTGYVSAARYLFSPLLTAKIKSSSKTRYIQNTFFAPACLAR